MREVVIEGEKITFIKVRVSIGKTSKIFEIPTIYFNKCYCVTLSAEPITKKEKKKK